jgi:hypothetical protein
MPRPILVAVAALLTAAPLAAGAAPETCEVKASGALTLDAKGPARASSFGSDYWLTDDELRSGLRVMAGIGKKLTDAEKDKEVEKAMKGDPRFMLFLLNCETDAVTISFGPSSSSRYADVPMKPKTYTLGGGMNAKPGEMQVLLNVKSNKGFWRALPGGKLDVTAFDKKHIAGTFEFTAREGMGKDQGPEARFTGSFDLPCKTSKACEK